MFSIIVSSFFSTIGATIGLTIIGAAAFAVELILAITVPIGTTAFTSNKISVIIPSVVEGISLSTLSVAISKSVSSS